MTDDDNRGLPADQIHAGIKRWVIRIALVGAVMAAAVYAAAEEQRGITLYGTTSGNIWIMIPEPPEELECDDGWEFVYTFDGRIMCARQIAAPAPVSRQQENPDGR